ncbi:alanine racemase [Marinitoga sp. 1135]|uniref:YggS family pyridoxal phosphate-dependent enzyme n=1 Tax=unclassified Marinitoga TaxID=2640159 RepID=UPI00158643C4|nr:MULTISPECIES: YggS family pyridoxal phosphate-dependent enzyme [unclassified Marinitoga]NUU95623.1 alanine racemase [Marinitoga sp. 1135]NUU97498.1 alanine racemase [Marinitoga sp. 1138]
MEFIKSNLDFVNEKIKESAERSNRQFDEIRLVAVSKTFPVDYIKAAYEYGIKNFGENKAQELRAKHQELEGYDITWHFIGRIQTNKVKYIVPIAEYIHSVYREKELKEIDKIAKKHNKIQKILIEVNVSGEETKGGIVPEEVEEFIKMAMHYENLEVVGLMTMAPYTDDKGLIKNIFDKLRELRDKLNVKYEKITELSMGMSNDYEIAVESGTTMVRIGSLIFGKRNYTTGG